MSATGHPDPAAALVGREREQAALRDALDAALAGRGSPRADRRRGGHRQDRPGRGAAAPRRREQGALVLVGRCYDLSETPPYGPWAEALARAPARRRRCPPPPDLAGRRARRSQAALFAAGARLPRRPRRAPARWSCCWRTCTGPTPPPSTCCASSARGLADLPLLAARHLPRRRGRPATTRSPPSCPSWCARPAPRGSTCARWTRTAIGALVAARYALAAADADRLVGYLAGRTEGNALFLGELLRTLEGEGLLRRRRRAAGRSATSRPRPCPRCCGRSSPGGWRGWARRRSGCWRWRRSSGRRCRWPSGRRWPRRTRTPCSTTSSGRWRRGCWPRRPTGRRCASPTR